jgi:uncharacterized protein YkwD
LTSVLAISIVGSCSVDSGDPLGADANPNAPDADPAAPDADPAAPDADPAAPDADPTTPDANPSTPDANPSTPDANPSTPDANPGTPDGAPDADLSNEPVGLSGITAAHNVVRADVGQAPLTWDPALAAIAQGWADQCIDGNGNGLIDHNPNRGDSYPGSVGENIYGSSSATASPIGAVNLWASEESNYNPADGSCSGVCGHYTQIVWSTTTKVGCGISDCSSLLYRGTIVCNYSPAGNSGGPAY